MPSNRRMANCVMPTTVTRRAHRTAPSFGRWVRWARASPTAGAGRSLERADDARCDPAAVEAAGLRHDALAVDEARVHAPGVERDMIGDDGERRTRRRVRPRRRLLDAVATAHREVVRASLPLAEGVAGGRRERAALNVAGREVVVRRMTGLEHAEGVRRVGDDDASEHDGEPFRHRLEPRRARVVPRRLLAGTDRFGFGAGGGSHHPTLFANFATPPPGPPPPNPLPGPALTW